MDCPSPDRLDRPWEVERDRFELMFSGPRLEVGEVCEVVPVSWEGLTVILDRLYPANVFDGSSGDPGPRTVALTREIGRLCEALEKIADARQWLSLGKTPGEIARAALDEERS